MSLHALQVRHLVALLIAFSSLVVAFPLAAQNRAFIVDLNTGQMTDLGTLGGRSTWAYGINEAGQVVGASLTTTGAAHAFMTGPDGLGMRDLGTLGGISSQARSINEFGQVVGWYDHTPGDPQAFITDANGLGIRNLGTLDTAYGINDTGQVAGNVGGRAVITGPNGLGVTEIDANAEASYARGINNAGQVIGMLAFGPWYPLSAAFVTGPNGVGVTDLGNLGGRYSSAEGINDSGQVAGSSEACCPSVRAFLASPPSWPLIDLGTLLSSSNAYGINDLGQVVGANSGPDVLRAFVTGPDGVGMIDLHALVDLPGSDSWATAINNRGQVIVNVTLIPEPASYALMLAGILLIVTVRARFSTGSPTAAPAASAACARARTAHRT